MRVLLSSLPHIYIYIYIYIYKPDLEMNIEKTLGNYDGEFFCCNLSLKPGLLRVFYLSISHLGIENHNNNLLKVFSTWKKRNFIFIIWTKGTALFKRFFGNNFSRDFTHKMNGFPIS
jgi:hypothetical protein